MPLTLEDIAHLSGVSRSTVSRVINADTNVKDETRQKVLQVIQSINFQPNLAARGLATGRTNVIGLVIPAGVSVIFTDPYFPQLIQGVSGACNTHNYSVMLWLAEPEYERRTISQILHNGLVDGVIVSSTLMDDPIVKSLYESKMPFILIGRHPSLDVNSIDVDNIHAGCEATLHLLRFGRKRIATITGPQNQIGSYDRYQGYLKGLSDRDQPVLPELVAEGDWTEAGGYAAMRRLIPNKPDAVFAANDVMAAGALSALREAQLRVPEDVAVVGFDDTPNASRTQPPLTTMRQPIQSMGTLAVETLIDIINHPGSETRQIIVATELVIRSSCGTLKSISEGGNDKKNPVNLSIPTLYQHHQ
ncbi:MAG: LacI family DNA-binding transcriptional regulator [Anaerolineales bacterium]